MKSPKQEVVDTEDFQKDELSTIFKKFDAKYKTDSEKDNSNVIVEESNEDGGGMQQYSPPSENSPNTEDSSSSSVPKPMPRTSRNNSLPDAQLQSPMEPPNVMPKPRPRTSATAYKVVFGILVYFFFFNLSFFFFFAPNDYDFPPLFLLFA